MRKTILILLAQGFEEMEAVISIDVLRRAGLKVTIASIGDSKMICGSRNIKIQAEDKLRNIKTLPDALLLPGGGEGTSNLAKSRGVADLIKRCHSKEKIIAAICAAPAVVLGPLGILDGRQVTCYPDLKNKFGPGTVYVEKKVVVDGNIITSQGPGTAFYFALKIIEMLKGSNAVGRVRRAALIK